MDIQPLRKDDISIGSNADSFTGLPIEQVDEIISLHPKDNYHTVHRRQVTGSGCIEKVATWQKIKQ